MEKFSQLQKIADRFNASYFPANKFCAFVSVYNENGDVLKMIKIAKEADGLKLLANGTVLLSHFNNDVQKNRIEIRVASERHPPTVFHSGLIEFDRKENLDFDLSDYVP